MGDKTVIETDATREMHEKVAAIVICKILRDSSLLEVLRIVISVRWGALGRLLESENAEALSVIRAQPVEGER